jgi:preprotein translocase subunit SecG
MLLFVTLLHIILCFILMLVILLQPGKGADVGAAFGGGGGSSTIFGPRGAGSFLSQATTIVAVLFMTTSVTLAVYSNAALRSGSDIENEIRRLQTQDEGEMYTVPEAKQAAAPEALPPEELFPEIEQPVEPEPVEDAGVDALGSDAEQAPAEPDAALAPGAEADAEPTPEG